MYHMASVRVCACLDPPMQSVEAKNFEVHVGAWIYMAKVSVRF